MKINNFVYASYLIEYNIILWKYLFKNFMPSVIVTNK